MRMYADLDKPYGYVNRIVIFQDKDESEGWYLCPVVYEAGIDYELNDFFYENFSDVMYHAQTIYDIHEKDLVAIEDPGDDCMFAITQPCRFISSAEKSTLEIFVNNQWKEYNDERSAELMRLQKETELEL